MSDFEISVYPKCKYWIYIVPNNAWERLLSNFKKKVYYLATYLSYGVKKNDIILIYLKHDINPKSSGFVSIMQAGNDLNINAKQINVFKDITINKYIIGISIANKLNKLCTLSMIETNLANFKANSFRPKYIKKNYTFYDIDKYIGCNLMECILNLNNIEDSQKESSEESEKSCNKHANKKSLLDGSNIRQKKIIKKKQESSSGDSDTQRKNVIKKKQESLSEDYDTFREKATIKKQEILSEDYDKFRDKFLKNQQDKSSNNYDKFREKIMENRHEIVSEDYESFREKVLMRQQEYSKKKLDSSSEENKKPSKKKLDSSSEENKKPSKKKLDSSSEENKKPSKKKLDSSSEENQKPSKKKLDSSSEENQKPSKKKLDSSSEEEYKKSPKSIKKKSKSAKKKENVSDADDEEEQHDENKSELESDDQDFLDDSEYGDENTEFIKSRIPILIVPCSNFIWEKPDKKIINNVNEHFYNCDKCEKIDNNLTFVDLNSDNNVTKVRVINDDEYVNKFCYYYHNLKRYKFRIRESEIKKTHIRICKISLRGHVYNNCLFILC